MAFISKLYIFPLKSCTPLEIPMADIEPRGIKNDRRWMVVDAEARFVTGRKQPRMTLIHAELARNKVILTAPGMPELILNEPASNQRVNITIWDDTVSAMLADDAAHAWMSTYLNQSVRVVYMDSQAQRVVDLNYGQTGDEVNFSDGYPLLLISQAALDQLNTKLQKPISILRFRPNLVIGDTDPHAEDEWKRIRIGEVELDVVKPCTRCVFTTVDFERGELDPSGEPLRTLITYRRTPKGVSFGQNLIPRQLGTIRVGDTVEILA